HFFNAKDAHFKKADESGQENLKAKQELIKEIQAYKVDKDAKKAMEVLKEFSARFNAIGNVPFKEKDKIYKTYKTAIDTKYDEMDIDQAEKEKLLFDARLENLKSSENWEDMIDREKQNVRKKMNRLK